MNSITKIAAEHNLTYITPADVNQALKDHPVDVVRKDVLEVLGETTGFGAEDGSLCAYIAWKGEYDPE